jgi:2-methylisocitrate lyase-like PEP mutase family enzyme
MTPNSEAFARLHVPGKPLILYNIWDAGSARAVAAAGASALATGSWGVAAAHGFKDGENFPLELAISNLLEILRVTDLPVTIDLEAGYGATPAEVGQSVQRAVDAGAAGINLEDKDPATRTLFDTADAAARVKAAAETGLFVNARADLFILTPAEAHDAALVDRVVERARAFADAGAGGLFVPFLRDETLIARVCERAPLPVNILIHPEGPGHKRLAELGVARISHGHGPWAAAMDWLTQQAKSVYQVEGGSGLG